MTFIAVTERPGDLHGNLTGTRKESWQHSSTCASKCCRYWAFERSDFDPGFLMKNLVFVFFFYFYYNQQMHNYIIYLSIRFYNSCRRLPETKRHSSLFLHWSVSKFLVVMAACTPSIHVFLGRPLFLLSSGTHSIHICIFTQFCRWPGIISTRSRWHGIYGKKTKGRIWKMGIGRKFRKKKSKFLLLYNCDLTVP